LVTPTSTVFIGEYVAAFGGGESKKHSYTPAKTVVRASGTTTAVADLQNDSYYDIPNSSGDPGCQAIDIWVLGR
jgi:hypothetical protein